MLAIVADEVLNKENQPIPVQFIQNPNSTKTVVQGVPGPGSGRRQDHRLPGLDPIDVRGKTLPQVRDTDHRADVSQEAARIAKGRRRFASWSTCCSRGAIACSSSARIASRSSRSSPPAGARPRSSAAPNAARRSRCYSNRAATTCSQALTQTGGPPGLEAKNEVIIRRGKYDPADPAKGYVRIPLRGRAGPADHVHRGGHHARRRRHGLHRGSRHRGLLHRRVCSARPRSRCRATTTCASSRRSLRFAGR